MAESGALPLCVRLLQSSDEAQAGLKGSEGISRELKGTQGCQGSGCQCSARCLTSLLVRCMRELTCSCSKNHRCAALRLSVTQQNRESATVVPSRPFDLLSASAQGHSSVLAQLPIPTLRQP